MIRVLALLLLLTGSAHADDDAVTLYRRGDEAFQAGRYREAIEAFAAGYKLDPRPEFLLNLAQCHRALGNQDKAIDYLERFLEEAPPGHRLRPAAEKTLAEIRATVPRPEPEPPRPPAKEPPRVKADPTPPPPPAVPNGQPRRDAPRKDSHVWVWVAAGAAVAAIATTVLLLSARDPAADVDDTIRLPPP